MAGGIVPLLPDPHGLHAAPLDDPDPEAGGELPLLHAATLATSPITTSPPRDPRMCAAIFVPSYRLV
jgi:hypothetical protein